MRELWSLQPRFLRRQGTRCLRLMNHPRFRAAYDFLLLRSEIGEVDPELADWWTQIQQAPSDAQKELTNTKHTGRRRKPRTRKPKSSDKVS
jgi:poly(A) polymerase